MKSREHLEKEMKIREKDISSLTHLLETFTFTNSMEMSIVNQVENLKRQIKSIKKCLKQIEEESRGMV